eukprot:15698-Alexandrium_andersonii.AAC.1
MTGVTRSPPVGPRVPLQVASLRKPFEALTCPPRTHARPPACRVRTRTSTRARASEAAPPTKQATTGLARACEGLQGLARFRQVLQGLQGLEQLLQAASSSSFARPAASSSSLFKQLLQAASSSSLSKQLLRAASSSMFGQLQVLIATTTAAQVPAAHGPPTLFECLAHPCLAWTPCNSTCHITQFL